MTNIFYDHLIAFDKIIVILDKHGLTLEEHQEILSIVDQHIHHEVINIILAHLPKDKHAVFLEKFHFDPTNHDLLTYLKTEIDNNFEEKLKKHIDFVLEDVIKEIRLIARPKSKAQK